MTLGRTDDAPPRTTAGARRRANAADSPRGTAGRSRRATAGESRWRTRGRWRDLLVVVGLVALLLSACGGVDGGASGTSGSEGASAVGDAGGAAGDGAGGEGASGDASAGSGAGGEGVVRLVTHDSFAVSEEVLAEFERSSGLTVEILQSGDAGQVVNQAILTAGNPQGDVLFGVDNTFLSRALDADLFEPYESPGLEQVPDDVILDDEHRVTPIDRGDVCLNYDRAYFASGDVAPPEDFGDLADPAYRDLTVVENPATSSPGLAFLLATVERFGEDGWLDYWRRLRDNGVVVASGWEEAYYGRFSGGSGEGDRPIVVSYASSPPAEVVFAESEPEQAPTAAVDSTCFEQIEFAGVLRGASNPEGARALIDFMLSRPFQEDIPLQMFVFPVHEQATLPEVFTEYAATPQDPIRMDYQQIGANRESWLDAWTDVVLR